MGLITDDLNTDKMEEELDLYRMKEPEDEESEEETHSVGLRVWTPDFEEGEKDDSFEIQMTALEATRTRLERELDSARKDYDAVEKFKMKEKKTIASEWSTTLGLIFIIAVLLFLTSAVPFPFTIAWVCLLFGGIVFCTRQIIAMMKRTGTYNILCISEPVSAFVEEKKINTFYKQQMYYYNRINEIKEHITELDGISKKLRKTQRLSDEEMERAGGLVHINRHPSIYTTEQFEWGDWIRFLFRFKK